MILSPTIHCNLKCKYCSVNTRSTDIKTLPFEFWKQWIEEAKPFMLENELWGINGGEPFLYKDLRPLVKFLSDQYPVELITNMILFEYYPEWNWKNIELKCSIEPGRSLHDSNRGFGTYDLVMDALRSKLPGDIHLTVMTLANVHTTTTDLLTLAEDVRRVHPNFKITANNLRKCPNLGQISPCSIWSVYPDVDAIEDSAFVALCNEAKAFIPELADFWKPAGTGCGAYVIHDFAIAGDRYMFCPCYVSGESFPIKSAEEILIHAERLSQQLPCVSCHNPTCTGCWNADKHCRICELPDRELKFKGDYQ